MSEKKPLRGQILGGIGLAMFGLLMLWRARFAMVHHTVLFPRDPSWGKSAWMDPWQAIAVTGICVILGLVLLLDAVKRN
jgi:glucose dehydrogenase